MEPSPPLRCVDTRLLLGQPIGQEDALAEAFSAGQRHRMLSSIENFHQNVPLVLCVVIVTIDYAHGVAQHHPVLEAQGAAGEKQQYPSGGDFRAHARGNQRRLPGCKVQFTGHTKS